MNELEKKLLTQCDNLLNQIRHVIESSELPSVVVIGILSILKDEVSEMMLPEGGEDE